ncbi:amidase [Sphaerisporangium melleum]|uniref:N-acetylmuramoyl-L-alanine amidase n=1 Tax=Sphaerisporangium melleum TaxID=321316 RepID=A0A917VRD8_9ACTN|nr:N-acetylmuramoyl-L-alanine amidase [Sphaerisporangium melleum]GGL11113.1 amidase [Sphaerisporangium melleum]GII69068.1 amidase [Sphaerisporangium melleum]
MRRTTAAVASATAVPLLLSLATPGSASAPPHPGPHARPSGSGHEPAVTGPRRARPPEGGRAVGAPGRQEAFRAAAARYGVPERVLLGVSYLESRWDGNRGLPSVAGGYGPMHLTDPRRAPGDAASKRGAPETTGTAGEAARLTGVPARSLLTDYTANVLGGAALLARHQRDLGLPADRDPAAWYGAVARYSGARDRGTASRFADEVFSLVKEGANRITDDGGQVLLPAAPQITPRMDQVERLGLPEAEGGRAECPSGLSCEWRPAPHRRLPGGGYGNHDRADRPRDSRVQYIVIHDTEETYAKTLKLVDDPAYVSWHYTIRSSDGHIAQHVRTRDIAWHAGNWYFNARSIGIEHEGFLTRPGAWYTEAMYRSSARLVRHLAKRYHIPLDRAHILGHDNIPGTAPRDVPGMHVDPGPYWDWGHYFALLGRPIKATAGAHGGLVTIRTDYRRHRPRYTGCGKEGADCPPHGSASVRLHIAPRADAPLVRDVGRRARGESTYQVYDHGARATTGQQFALAGRRGDWTAIWYLGQRAWFHNPEDAPTAVNATGLVVTPRPGRDAVPVYGRAYPEPEAYPLDVPVQPIVPLQYAISPGQRYAVGLATRGEHYHATTFERAGHRRVRGRTLYFQIQFGHRVAFVRAGDVEILPASLDLPR